MKSRQLVFKTSLTVRPSVQKLMLSQFRLCLISAICFLALAGNLAAQFPMNPGSENSLSTIGQTIQNPNATVLPKPVVIKPMIRQSDQQNLVPGTVIPGSALIAKPEREIEILRRALSSISDVVELAAHERSPHRVVGIAEEINSIRKQLGGGLSQHFGKITNADAQWKESLEASFQNELNRLAGQSKREPEHQLERQPDHSIGQEEILRENYLQSAGQHNHFWSSNSIVPRRSSFQMNPSPLNRSRERVAFGNPGSVSPANNPADQLRGAARTLDQMASQFETSGLYEEADQVRAQAQKLWLKSRTFQNDSTDR